MCRRTFFKETVLGMGEVGFETDDRYRERDGHKVGSQVEEYGRKSDKRVRYIERVSCAGVGAVDYETLCFVLGTACVAADELTSPDAQRGSGQEQRERRQGMYAGRDRD